MLTLEKHRLYDLKIQLSLLPQLGCGKISVFNTFLIRRYARQIHGGSSILG